MYIWFPQFFQKIFLISLNADHKYPLYPNQRNLCFFGNAIDAHLYRTDILFRRRLFMNPHIFCYSKTFFLKYIFQQPYPYDE